MESNGPGNQSTPRQIVDVELLDRSFTTPTDAFVINDDVTSRFVQGFVFTVVGGPYAGSYAVAAPGVLAGDIAAQVVAGQTHIPVVNIVSTAIPYALFAGFTTPNISPTTARNYLVTWQLAGNVAALFVPNSTMQIKRFSYNGVVVNRVYTVVSSTYNGINYTNVVTALYDESVSMPVLGG